MEERVANVSKRINCRDDLYEKIANYPKNYDALKNVFGSSNIVNDIFIQEYIYIKNDPKSSFNMILKKVKTFPDYIDYFPKGAISRKIAIVLDDYDLEKYIIDFKSQEYIFFSQSEINNFINSTSEKIYKTISGKGII